MIWNWRAGVLGWLLGIHSPIAHVNEACWCKRTKREITVPGLVTKSKALADMRSFAEYFEGIDTKPRRYSKFFYHSYYTNEFGYCDDPFCDLEEAHKHGDLCHMNCSCKREGRDGIPRGNQGHPGSDEGDAQA